MPSSMFCEICFPLAYSQQFPFYPHKNVKIFHNTVRRPEKVSRGERGHGSLFLRPSDKVKDIFLTSDISALRHTSGRGSYATDPLYPTGQIRGIFLKINDALFSHHRYLYFPGPPPRWSGGIFPTDLYFPGIGEAGKYPCFPNA